MKINRPFADCKIADLHLADAIQPFGAMVMMDRGDTVVAVSANCEAFLGVPSQDLLGTDARASWSPRWARRERSCSASPTGSRTPRRRRTRRVS